MKCQNESKKKELVWAKFKLVAYAETIPCRMHHGIFFFFFAHVQLIKQWVNIIKIKDGGFPLFGLLISLKVYDIMCHLGNVKV